MVFGAPDAKEFRAERWLEDGILKKAQEMQAYRHILPLPRTYFRKGFAVAEIKMVLTVLVKNFIMRKGSNKVVNRKGNITKAHDYEEVGVRYLYL
ncbi:hypothetical protein ID866_8641 [Astraeus odoratus]|nr:hypothetical protein ID866_8641 [Astraeus odoratus]